MYFASIMPLLYSQNVFPYDLMSYISSISSPMYNIAYTLGKINQILSLHIFSQYNLVKPQKSPIFFWSCILCESYF